MITAKDSKLRALSKAIEANTGLSYDDSNKTIVDADKILIAARKFEAYIDEQNEEKK